MKYNFKEMSLLELEKELKRMRELKPTKCFHCVKERNKYLTFLESQYRDRRRKATHG